MSSTGLGSKELESPDNSIDKSVWLITVTSLLPRPSLPLLHLLNSFSLFYLVPSQSEVKDNVIRGQLSQLRAVLPTIKLHLTMCASVSNAASKYDFLDLAYPLIDRLTAITHMGYPIRWVKASLYIRPIYETTPSLNPNFRSTLTFII